MAVSSGDVLVNNNENSVDFDKDIIDSEGTDQAEKSTKSKRVDVKSVYQRELVRIKAETIAIGLRVWDSFKEKAKPTLNVVKENPILTEVENKPLTFKEKLHRRILSIQAQVEGVKDLAKFNDFVNYLESTLTEARYKNINIPNNITNEEKNNILKGWQDKGWSFSEYPREEENEVKPNTAYMLKKEKPFLIERRNVRAILKLINRDNNPIEITRNLVKIGFTIEKHNLQFPTFIEEMAKFYTSPYALEAIKLVQENIPYWNLSDENSYSDRNSQFFNDGKFKFLTELSQSDSPNNILSKENAEKINILAAALKKHLSPEYVKELNEMVENPDQLEFITILLDRNVCEDSSPDISTVKALDEAGVLKDLITLSRIGIWLDPEELNTRTARHGSIPSISKLFNSSDREANLESTITHLKKILSGEDIVSILSDSAKVDFLKIYTDLTGETIHPENLGDYIEYFQRCEGKLEQAHFVIKLIKSFNRDEKINLLDIATFLERTDSSFETLTNPNFLNFLKLINEKAGVKINSFDLLQGETGSYQTVFNDTNLLSKFTKDTTLEIIKAIHPNGEINFKSIDYYDELGNTPGIANLILSLKGLGFQFDPSLLPSLKELGLFLSTPDLIKIINSENTINVFKELNEKCDLKLNASDLVSLLKLLENPNLLIELSKPETIDYLSKVKGSSNIIADIENMLSLDSDSRELLIQIVETYAYSPNFNIEFINQKEMLLKILDSKEMRDKIFSEKSKNIFGALKKTDPKFRIKDLNQLEMLSLAPDDFIDFVNLVQTKYHSELTTGNFNELVKFSLNRTNYFRVIDKLVEYGESYMASGLIEKRLDSVGKLVDNFDQLDTVLIGLKSVIGYRFDTKDMGDLVNAVENKLNTERIRSLKIIHSKYFVGDNISISLIEDLLVIEQNSSYIESLKTIKYVFSYGDFYNLKKLFTYPNKETLLTALQALHKDNNKIKFQPSNIDIYLSLAEIPDINDKINAAIKGKISADFVLQDNLRLFSNLGANAETYSHAKELMNADYFRNIRDAGNRLNQFLNALLNSALPKELAIKIFNVCKKPTELGDLSVKVCIVSELVSLTNNPSLLEPVLKGESYIDVENELNKLLFDLGLPQIYSNLDKDGVQKKISEIKYLSLTDKDFQEAANLCCMALSIYTKAYGKDSPVTKTLIAGIRKTLDLNLDFRDPKDYLSKRIEGSKNQFGRVLEGLPQNVTDAVLKMWQDISNTTTVRTLGIDVIKEEDTLRRLKRIKQTVEIDLAIHLNTKLKEKINIIQKQVESGQIKGKDKVQWKIYQEYLLTPEGNLRTDLPQVYKEIKTFIRASKNKIKDPNIPKDEKLTLVKELGVYQNSADMIRTIYKLSNISEQKFKVKRNYAGEVDKDIVLFRNSLKSLGIITDRNTELYEKSKQTSSENTSGEKKTNISSISPLDLAILNDLDSIVSTISEESIQRQVIFNTETTVKFTDLAKAPEMNTSCQRLTERTEYNQAAFSRLLDGNDEMLNSYTEIDGNKVRLARCFVELSKIEQDGIKDPKTVLLLDRLYVNPSYGNLSDQFAISMLDITLKRLEGLPEVSILLSGTAFAEAGIINKIVEAYGYRIRVITGKYFINESKIPDKKYYDSFDGLRDVSTSTYYPFASMYLIEKK